MRRAPASRRALAASLLAAGCLLLGPTVLAFFSGGYYAQPRLIAALVAWLLVLALAITGPAPLPRTAGGRLAAGGLVAITVWSAVSLTWAPLRGAALDNVQRLVLYSGALLAAMGALRDRRAMRAVEPVLAVGASVVIGYGLAGRLLPRLVDLARSRSAGGRLEQPITYWNAEGVLAAMGLLLCARMAGDRTRPPAVRMLAAAAVTPLGAGVYLSYSRGAIAVAVLGVVCLVAAAPTWSQLRAAGAALVTAVLAAAATGAFPGVASLEGALGDRTREGAIALALLAGIAVAAAGLTAWLVVAGRSGDARLPWRRRAGPVVAALVAVTMVGLVVGGIRERPSPADLSAGAKATRLASVTSNRYEYWHVGLRAFAEHPVAGLGSGGFRVEWLKRRTIDETVRDVHSLELEMAAELGLVGLLAFATMIAGVLLCARTALRRAPVLAAGWAVTALAWLLHASIDWDWQLPAVSLPAVLLAGALIALAESEEPHAGAETPAVGRAAPGALSVR